jgi:hypothetical protein
MPLPFPQTLNDEALESLIRAIFALPYEDQLPAAYECIQGLTAACASGHIGREDACFYIAELTFLPAVEANEPFTHVCLRAGTLELPDHHFHGTVDALWREYVREVDALPAPQYSPRHG